MEKITITKECKRYILNYLDSWIVELSKHKFSYRKGIVRAIYNFIDSIEVN